MRRISETLGVARSNMIERRDVKRPPRGPQGRPGDIELAGAIRRLVDPGVRRGRLYGTGGSPRH